MLSRDQLPDVSMHTVFLVSAWQASSVERMHSVQIGFVALRAVPAHWHSCTWRADGCFDLQGVVQFTWHGWIAPDGVGGGNSAVAL